MCRTTVQQKWWVIGERFKSTGEYFNQGCISCQRCVWSAHWQCRWDASPTTANWTSCRHQGESLCSTICRRNIRLALPSRKALALFVPPYQCCRYSTSKCRTTPLGCAQSFASDVSGARSAPCLRVFDGDSSTADYRCHHYTRRAHSLLKGEITLSALLCHGL